MTTLTLQIPKESANKYKEILNYFVINYKITELEQIKNDIEFSKQLYNDYKMDINWQKNIGVIKTKWKSKKELLSNLNNTLWN